MGIVKIAGCWDDVWFPTRLIEYNSRWKFLVQGFDLDGFYMSPITGFIEEWRTPHNIRDTVVEVDSIETAIAANSELVPVLIDENSTTLLQTFIHPPNAIYCFGATGKSFHDGWKGLSVAIEQPTSFAPYLQPDQAVAIVLYDRMVKSWQ